MIAHKIKYSFPFCNLFSKSTLILRLNSDVGCRGWIFAKLSECDEIYISYPSAILLKFSCLCLKYFIYMKYIWSLCQEVWFVKYRSNCIIWKETLWWPSMDFWQGLQLSHWTSFKHQVFLSSTCLQYQLLVEMGIQKNVF